jgi:tetratricopeptide (TPR) repeat protein
MKFLLLAAMLLTIAAPAFCAAADVSTNTVNAKPGVMNGVFLGWTNTMTVITPEEQAAHFDNGWEGYISRGTEAIKLNPDDSRAYARRAHAEMSKGDYESAIADYTKAIELAPNITKWNYFNLRGNAKWRKHDWDGAIADMTKAIELDPNNFTASEYSFLANTYTQAGHVKISKGELDGAIADFTKSLEIKPDDVAAYNMRGGAKLFKGDLDGAIADYNKSIELKPANPKPVRVLYFAAVYYNRGLAKAAKEDLAGAKADFNDALKLNPDFSDAQMRLDELNKQ